MEYPESLEECAINQRNAPSAHRDSRKAFRFKRKRPPRPGAVRQAGMPARRLSRRNSRADRPSTHPAEHDDTPAGLTIGNDVRCYLGAVIEQFDDEHQRRSWEEREVRRLAGELRLLLVGDDTAEDEGISVVQGQRGIMNAYEEMLGDAQGEFWGCDRPPYADQRTDVSDQVKVFLRKKSEGIRFRMLFDTEVMTFPNGLERVRGARMSGQAVRLLSGTPFKIAIADRSTALIAASDGREVDTALLVRPSPMLDVVVAAFETFWAAATPLRVDLPSGSGSESPITAQEHDLIALLVAGVAEEQIAVTLGLSERTTRRKIRDLMDALEAETRFQAGVRATRLGWF
ncbi:helix-turn-helix transcriptional regulator [Lentzea sp. HUAS12]|uniref:helix-turn-helix transcriptional regulator n=1 Tax=Lentzea sp. HUAS12 TaxID=2951806 RepID=UPI0020A2208E|nr:helix-turn-helix transcriptional regulator [Lentzea sp. HUAS12]USX56273.1 helix-turn-helix transcriptional regulator [Lentzea sp. HUAS12]